MYPYGAPQYNGYQPPAAQNQPSNAVATHNFGSHPAAHAVPNDYYSRHSYQNHPMMFQNPLQHHVSAYQLPVRPEVQASYPSAEAPLAHAGKQYHAVGSAGISGNNYQPHLHAYVQGSESSSLLRVIGVPAPPGGSGAAAALTGSGPPLPGSPGVRPQPLAHAKPDPAEWNLPVESSSTAPPLLRADVAYNMRYAGPTQIRLKLQHPACMDQHCCGYCSQGRPRNRPMIRCMACSRLHHIGTYWCNVAT